MSESVNTGDKNVSEAKADNNPLVAKNNRKVPYRIIGTIGFKVWAIIGILISTALLITSVLVAIEMYEDRMFSLGYSEKEVIYNKISIIGWDDAESFLYYYLDMEPYRITDECENSNVQSVSISVIRDTPIESDVEMDSATETDSEIDTIVEDTVLYSVDESSNEEEIWSYGDTNVYSPYSYKSCSYIYNDETGEGLLYLCTITIDPEMRLYDDYRATSVLFHIFCKIRYGIFAIGVAFGIIIILLFVELMIAVGHTRGTEEVHPAFDAKCPFDVLTVIMVGSVFLVAYCLFNWMKEIIAFILVTIAIEILALLWCMSFASRIKNHNLWKGMLICTIFRFLGKVISLLPVVWKLAIGGVVGSAINAFLVFWMASGRRYGLWVERDIAFVIWVFFMIAQFCGLVYIGAMLKRLQKNAKDLAEGKTDQSVNDKWMLPVFKEHAKNLMAIREGMNSAVEKKISSERMQAQLITNVSHDIKTPLTSIINYSDLICKEECDNEKIHEYAEVLGRQSHKLKRLLEDLVEASKASSGNLEVQCIPCKAGVLVSQAAGEYEERMQDSGLELVIKNTDSPAMIMADPRRMWRVFDNLLGNICKYAQKNTRVYINIEETDDKCSIIFKNTSATELDINPEELMERFVRGDKSRNTEGHGLGMSIASNMIKLQGGEMKVNIDGDLFKVSLEFPRQS